MSRRGTSAPTERVVDVVEFIANRRDGARFSDVAREVGLTQGTANAILNSLSDRGWLIRDPSTKVYRPGPALAAVAAATEATQPLTHTARQAAARLAAELRVPASVVERVKDSLVIVAIEGSWTPETLPGERIPYAPPFGVAFAAWAPPDEQRAWLARNPDVDAAAAKRLRSVLKQTRERGFDVDWTTPVLARVSRLLGEVRGDRTVPDPVLAVLDKALIDCAKVGYRFDDDPEIESQPVATIAAPVFDEAGRVALILGVHPGRALPLKEIRRIGNLVTEVAAGLNPDQR